jgi:hypothetical protein
MLKIVEVNNRRLKRQFIGLPWLVHDSRRSPQWIPPLKWMTRLALDTSRNAFYRNAEIQLFLATRDDRPIGRIAAIENRMHNRFHADRVGFFGFFECAEDEKAAGALLDAAADWLRSRGLMMMRGPVSPSMNHECGTLVEGFEHAATLSRPWNPRYYMQLLEHSALIKARDLLGYRVGRDWLTQAPKELEAFVGRIRERTTVTVREFDRRHFNRDLQICLRIRNEAWCKNWGFFPTTGPEMKQMGKALKMLVDPRFLLIAESGGAPAGYYLWIPNYNEIIAHASGGRISPRIVWRFLTGRRHVQSISALGFGVLEEFRKKHTMLIFNHEFLQRFRQSRIEWLDASWVLENNDAMNHFLTSMGFQVYKRWRIYERSLSQ